jgi:hypothetical protein
MRWRFSIAEIPGQSTISLKGKKDEFGRNSNRDCLKYEHLIHLVKAS